MCTGFDKSILPRDFTARERNTTGKESISTGTVPMGAGNQDFHGNHMIPEINISSGIVWVGPRER